MTYSMQQEDVLYNGRVPNALKLLSILLATAAMILCSGHANAITFYVAPDGSNRASGLSFERNGADGPLADIGSAITRAIEYRQKHKSSLTPVAIAVADGVYRVSEPIVLPAGASGSANAPLRIYAMNPGAVWISGGKALTGFRPLRAGEANELPGTSRSAVRVYDFSRNGPVLHGLQPHGWGEEPSVANTELYFGDKRMPMARWPQTGFARIEAVRGDTGRQFVSEQPLPTGSILGKDSWAVGYWYYDWAMEVLPVSALNGRQNDFELGGTPNFSTRAGQRFFLINVLSQLASSGEWVLDATNQRIYFWPPSSDLSQTEISDAESLVRVEGASHIELDGLNFKLARGPAIVIRDSQNVRVNHAEIRGIGGRAIDAVGKEIEISNCRIHDVGDGGVYIGGGDRKTLAPGGSVVKNNEIYDFNRWNYTYRPAISLWGVGNIAENNIIHDAPHLAIKISGNDNIVRFNEIYNVVEDTSDAGVIYLGRDWTQRGNVISDNYIHNIGKQSKDARGVYLDDQVSGTIVERNVFYKVPKAVYVGGGRDNVVVGNLFVDSAPPISIDDRGVSWQADWVRDPGGPFRKALNAVPYQGFAYAKYPHLSTILMDNVGAPKYNIVSSNLMIRSGCVNLSGDGFRNGDFSLRSTDNVCLPEADVFLFSNRIPKIEDFELPATFRSRPSGFVGASARRVGPQAEYGQP
ncbi:right-handed parallel beta-helix repeat-containing protein [Paraburkholderia sp. HP33-1]|uniref:right-handed parallel beta-helix repeat-containing protein n=1 Tax=Paraburkholderia sp. HP33-1 TaxID=2883243 RepID=UPI001F20C57A|nr:right-handed parallel beta-helix repeat-containing protein [Paraburkholderia sp. HP33-1]